MKGINWGHYLDHEEELTYGPSLTLQAATTAYSSLLPGLVRNFSLEA